MTEVPNQPDLQELVRILQKELIEVINQVDLEYDLAAMITEIVICPVSSGNFKLVINTK